MKAATALACLLVAVPASAQEPPVPTQTPKAQYDEQIRRRDQIAVMESALTIAVRSGAQRLSSQWRAIMPNSVVVTGTARARGFPIEGYGAFFDVEIPGLSQSFVFTTSTLGPAIERALASLQHAYQSITDTNAKRDALQALNLIQVQMGPLLPERPSDNRGVKAAVAEPDAQPAPASTNPNDQYTDAVKDAMIDVMLEYGGNLGLGANDWLTVAARDAEGPLPGALYDTVTIFLRIRGSDLAAFRQNQITRAEARNKVEVREF